MKAVDLNCDMGESFGPWRMGCDAEIMPLISSVNIACGFHAGDPSTIAGTIDLAVEHSVSIGAHPGYPDLQGFGRRNMILGAAEVFNIVQYQVSAVKGMCEARGAKLRHVKPHGALYNQAAKDPALAGAIAQAIAAVDPSLTLYGLSGSCLIDKAREAGLHIACEAFADRTYQPDGSLTPRTNGNALVSEPESAAEQALKMVLDGVVTAVNGTAVRIDADTICIHGDAPQALAFALAIREVLERNGIIVRAPHSTDEK